MKAHCEKGILVVGGSDCFLFNCRVQTLQKTVDLCERNHARAQVVLWIAIIFVEMIFVEMIFVEMIFVEMIFVEVIFSGKPLKFEESVS